MATEHKKPFSVGERHTVTIEKVAHGGHFIARHEGQVIFVRHAIPGEVVEAEITSTGASFVRADAVEIVSASPDRISSPCQYSHPGGCGGCDFQHISIERQRVLKADVIREQFSRLAKMEIEIEVEKIGEPLHWRTRLGSATDASGNLGFYASRTHSVVPVSDCLIASEAMNFSELAERTWPANSRVEISVSSEGMRTVAIADAARGSKPRLTQGQLLSFEDDSGHRLQVSHSSFWQSHESAPEALIRAITPHVRQGDRVLDLYGGVGLFTAALIDIVGEKGTIDIIESSSSATADARKNFATMPNVRIHTGEVVHLLPRISKSDVIVLDPPREGAGKKVVSQMTSLAPRTIVYVACDPAALARDVSYFAQEGYALTGLRAFDLFPMTHHVECVATFAPVNADKNKVS